MLISKLKQILKRPVREIRSRVSVRALRFNLTVKA